MSNIHWNKRHTEPPIFTSKLIPFLSLSLSLYFCVCVCVCVWTADLSCDAHEQGITPWQNALVTEQLECSETIRIVFFFFMAKLCTERTKHIRKVSWYGLHCRLDVRNQWFAYRAVGTFKWLLVSNSAMKQLVLYLQMCWLLCIEMFSLFCTVSQFTLVHIYNIYYISTHLLPNISLLSN